LKDCCDSKEIQEYNSILRCCLEYQHFGVRPVSGIFENKNTEAQVALSGNFSSLVSATDPVKGSKDAASLLVCTRKNVLLEGCRFFVSDVISEGLLGHLGPLYLALGANR